MSGELRILAALTSGVEPTELSEWKTVWDAGLAWWPKLYLTRVGLKLFPKFCGVNYVKYLFIVVYNIG